MDNELKIKVVKGGPYVVSGKFILVNADGEEKEAEKVFLCRCGQSKNKPFCDGAHTKIDFDN